MARPSLSHYIDYPVLEVRESADDEREWELVFAGNRIVRNLDKRRAAPTGIKGVPIRRVIEGDQTTDIEFGYRSNNPDAPLPPAVATVTLTNSRYVIVTADSDEAVFAGIEEAPEDTLPPDPSAERVARSAERPPKPTPPGNEGEPQ